MPTTERAVERICSTCGADMIFIDVVDKETKEARPLEGMLLSGTIRRYQCPKGHVETNEG